MIDAPTYLEHIRRDGSRIPEIAQGNLETAVSTCPGNTVASMLLHTMAVCAFWTGALEQNGMPQGDMPSFGNDPVEAHRRSFDAFIQHIATRQADEPTWTWGGMGTVGFWYRRAAQELAVHRWDIENAVGDPEPIDPMLAMDGVDEFLFSFGPATGDPNFPGASAMFAGDGQTFRLEPTDGPDPITFTALPDRFETTDAVPDVTARGTASELLLFMWGRIPTSTLDVEGDAALLDRWQERVKI